MSVAVHADVFPALVEITYANGTRKAVDRCRALVTDEGTGPRLLIFTDGAAGPQLVYSQRVADYVAPSRAQRLRELHQPEFRRHTARLVDQDGTVVIEKSSGCGCGSRLKSFNPFTTIPTAEAVS